MDGREGPYRAEKGGNRAEKEVASSTPLHIHEAPKCVAIDDKTEANRASHFLNHFVTALLLFIFIFSLSLYYWINRWIPVILFVFND